MSDRGKLPPGTMECSDYTRGHNAPIPMPGPWETWTGRKDIAVYLIAGVLFFGAVLLVRSYHGTFWSVFGTSTGTMVMLTLMLVVPVLAGVVASMAGLKVRDLPVLASAALAMFGESFQRRGLGQDGPIRREPKVKLRARARNGSWNIPERGR